MNDLDLDLAKLAYMLAYGDLADKTVRAFKANGVAYHGSHIPPDRIMAEGLVPMGSIGADQWARNHGHKSEGRPLVFLATEKQVAANFAWLSCVANHERVAYVYKITVPEDQRKAVIEDERDAEALAYPGKIPPGWISEHSKVSGDALKRAEHYEKCCNRL